MSAAPAELWFLRLGCRLRSVNFVLSFFFVVFLRTWLVDDPVGLGQRVFLGGNHVARRFLAKRHFCGVGDFRRFRRVPQPVRFALGIVAYQMHLHGAGGEFVRPVPLFDVLKGKCTPLTDVKQIA